MNEIKNNVINDDVLFASLKKCKNGVLYKSSAAFCYLHGMTQIIRLKDQLEDGTYKPRKAKVFEITHPKHRTIVSIAFRDRVYQRALNDIIVYPKMTKQFIYDNAACQKNKGTDFARERLIYFLRDCYRKNGPESYVLKADIKGYYNNMSHDLAKEKFREKLDDWTYGEVVKIIDGQYSGEVGFNPGSQMIQILGISMLSKVDHFIKERLRIKYYLRYQDDFILIHPDKNYLEYCRAELEKELGKIGLKFNVKKTKIQKTSNKLEFLGFDFHITKTGKVVMNVTGDKVKEKKRHFRKMVAKCKRGEIPRYKVDESFESTMNHYNKGNSEELIRRMRQFYKSLWKEQDNGTRNN